MSDDFELVLAAAQQGEGWAFEQLFRWLGPTVVGYLRARRVDDADDLANEVFLRAFRAVGTFRGDAGRFRSWIFTIAHNAALDDRRQGRRRPLVAEAATTSESCTRDVAEDVLERLARERVESLLAHLVPDQREVFLLRVVGDLSIAQTAGVLGKSYEAVKALQRRGAKTLKRLLEAEGVPK